MKKTLTNKIYSFILAVALLLGTLTFAIFAAAPTADDFNNAVSAIQSAETLTQRETKLGQAADILDAYVAAGGTVSDAEIKSAYDIYLTEKADIEQKVGYCNDFVNAVSAALEETAPYVTVRDSLDLAETLLDKIDEDYGSVGLHREFYDEMRAELKIPIKVCEDFISYAALAAEAKTYAEASKNIDLASAAKKAITILDYPGLEEAEEDIATAKNFMYQQIYNATPFCDAVKNINKAKSVPIGIKEAYEILKTVDATAENAVTALNNLKKAERSYNKSAKAGNEAVDEIAELCFAILF